MMEWAELVSVRTQYPYDVLPAPPLSSAGYLLTVASPVDGMCSEGCGCDSTTYSPVCDVSTGLTHFSPCHAGCVNITHVR